MLSRNNDLSDSTVLVSGLSPTQHPQSTELQEGVTYYWSVIARDGDGRTSWADKAFSRTCRLSR